MPQGKKHILEAHAMCYRPRGRTDREGVMESHSFLSLFFGFKYNCEDSHTGKEGQGSARPCSPSLGGGQSVVPTIGFRPT